MTVTLIKEWWNAGYWFIKVDINGEIEEFMAERRDEAWALLGRSVNRTHCASSYEGF